MSGRETTRSDRYVRRMVTPVLIAMTALCVGTSVAQAAGQCDFLSFRRNRIYKEAGYCFKTAAQIQIFGNAGCQYDSQLDVPLSARQRAEVAAIVREERGLGCR